MNELPQHFHKFKDQTRPFIAYETKPEQSGGPVFVLQFQGYLLGGKLLLVTGSKVINTVEQHLDCERENSK